MHAGYWHSHVLKSYDILGYQGIFSFGLKVFFNIFNWKKLKLKPFDDL